MRTPCRALPDRGAEAARTNATVRAAMLLGPFLLSGEPVPEERNAGRARGALERARGAAYGRAYDACHVIECHSTQETRV